MVGMISKGRMGNFMWVAAAAYVYALKHGLEFHVQSEQLDKQWPLYLQHLQNPNWDASLPQVFVNDGRHTFVNLPFNESWRDKNIIIGTRDINTGYFQSHLYIKGYEEEVREAFKLDDVHDLHGVCSVHYRGMDYHAMSDRHPPITLDYVLQAVRHIICNTNCRRFYICSDDEIRSRQLVERLKFHIISGEFHLVSSGDEIKDFRGMMACEHNIVANSSYSVLAAFLNPHKDKIVVCPHEDNFMGINNKHLDVSTLYPSDWVRIKY